MTLRGNVWHCALPFILKCHFLSFTEITIFRKTIQVFFDYENQLSNKWTIAFCSQRVRKFYIKGKQVFLCSLRHCVVTHVSQRVWQLAPNDAFLRVRGRALLRNQFFEFPSSPHDVFNCWNRYCTLRRYSVAKFTRKINAVIKVITKVVE